MLSLGDVSDLSLLTATKLLYLFVLLQCSSSAAQKSISLQQQLLLHSAIKTMDI